MSPKIIYLNGKCVRASNRLIASLAPGTIKGKGVFETMRAYKGKVFAFEAHMARMQKGLKTIGVNQRIASQRILENIFQLLTKNRLKNARIRVAAWKDKNFQTAIVCQAYQGPSHSKCTRGFQAIISSMKRNRSRYSSIKSLDYRDFQKAYAQARDQGCDEAILLNEQKNIVEGSRTNIFLVKKEKLFTPSLASGCLDGITRNRVIQCARAQGFSVAIKKIKLNDLWKAEEVFLTNSLLEVMPLTVVNHRPIGSGKMGPVTKRLGQLYRQHVCHVL